MGLGNIRILEGKSLLWDDITNAYKSKVDVGDYILMHGIDSEKFKTLVTAKPFFSENYVIELHLSRVNNKILNQLVKYLKCEWIVLIIVLTSKDDYDLTSTVIKKGFNGYKISYNYWCGYVKRRLKSEPKCNLEEVYKKLSGRFELTDIVIDVLNKTESRISIASLSKIIGKRDAVSLDILWFKILTCDVKSKRQVFKYLEEYRYGYNFIFNNLKEKYYTTLKYYDDFYNGKLNELNLMEYKRESHMSEWLIRSYIRVFSTVSFDELLIIGQMIECSNVNSTASLFELIGRLYGRKNGLCKVVI